MPVMQLLVLAYAATFEIKSVKLYVVDHDNTVESRSLLSHFRGSPFYRIISTSGSYNLAEEDLIAGKVDQIIVINNDFATSLESDKETKVQIVTDAIDGSAASLMAAYSMSIIRDFNKSLIVESLSKEFSEPIDIRYSFWFNPELNYKNYMVPGLLVILVTIIGMFLAGMNLVKEKEVGTIEQINVTPIRKYQFIIGKLLPFWIVALFELAFGLILAKLLFNIPIVGNVALIFLVGAVYLMVVQGMGLFLSTVTNTQQQAMFLSWFFAVVFILMSGLFTPIESMPHWAQVITWFNPIAYFIEAIRMIMLKGSELVHVLKNILVLLVYAIFIFSLAVWRYHKVSD
jgi:ABC-2 type transport system permease protein